MIIVSETLFACKMGINPNNTMLILQQDIDVGFRNNGMNVDGNLLTSIFMPLFLNPTSISIVEVELFS